jgi:hypothetical protein
VSDSDRVRPLPTMWPEAGSVDDRGRDGGGGVPRDDRSAAVRSAGPNWCRNERSPVTVKAFLASAAKNPDRDWPFVRDCSVTRFALIGLA